MEGKMTTADERRDDRRTWFGKNANRLIRLEDALRSQNFTTHGTLLIGAGLNTPELPPTSSHIDDQLAREYSWEYLELAAVLQRLGKPWWLTVADYSEEVCKAVSNQRQIFVADRWIEAESRMRQMYFRDFVTSLEEATAVPDECLKQLHLVGISEAYTARIPQSTIEHITVVKKDITNSEQWLDWHGRFNVVVCYAVMIYVRSGIREATRQNMRDILAHQGMLSLIDNLRRGECGIGLQRIGTEEIVPGNGTSVRGLYQRR